MKEARLVLVIKRAPQEQRRQAPQPAGAGTSSTRTVQVSQQVWEPKAENSHPYRKKETTGMTRWDTSPTQAEMPQLGTGARGISAGGSQQLI